MSPLVVTWRHAGVGIKADTPSHRVLNRSLLSSLLPLYCTLDNSVLLSFDPSSSLSPSNASQQNPNCGMTIQLRDGGKYFADHERVTLAGDLSLAVFPRAAGLYMLPLLQSSRGSANRLGYWHGESSFFLGRAVGLGREADGGHQKIEPDILWHRSLQILRIFLP